MRYGLLLAILVLTSCGTDEDEQSKRYKIKNNSGSLTRNSDNTISVSATLLDSDGEAQADVAVIFLINCDGDTVVSVEATTNDEGVATASTTEAVPEQNCSVTLQVDDGITDPIENIASEPNTKDNDEEPPSKLMGKVHTITWTATMGASDLNACNSSTGVLALKATNPTKITVFRGTTSNSNTPLDVVVLPINEAKSVSGKDPSCHIAGIDIVFDNNSYNTTTVADFKAMDCSNAGTCFSLLKNNQAEWTIGKESSSSSAAAESKWIRRTQTTNDQNETVHSYVLYELE